MANIKTIFTTDVAGNSVKENILQQIQLCGLSHYPLQSLLINSGAMITTGSNEVKWIETDVASGITTLNNGGNAAAGDVSIVVTDGSIYTAQDMFIVDSTQEIIQIGAVSGNTLSSLTRSVGSIAAAIIVDGSTIRRVGSAFSEGSDTPTINMEARATKTAYLQIFKNTYSHSESIMASETRGVSPDGFPTVSGNPSFAGEHKTQMIKHLIDIEHALLFGDATTSGSKKTTDGLNSAITTNVSAIGGVLTEAAFNTNIQTALDNGADPNNLLLVCSPTVNAAISNMSLNRQQVTETTTTGGIAITKYQTHTGEIVNIMPHRFLRGTVYSGYGFILDFSRLRLPFLRSGSNVVSASGDRYLRLKENVQNPGVDGVKNEILSEVGLVVGCEKSHVKLTGITG